MADPKSPNRKPGGDSAPGSDSPSALAGAVSRSGEPSGLGPSGEDAGDESTGVENTGVENTGDTDSASLVAGDQAAPDRALAWQIGRDHELSASKERRRQRGAFYTPKSVVQGLLRLAIPDSGPIPANVLDPTCGGGAFLVGALDRLVERGIDPGQAFGRVWAIDIDPGAVAATMSALLAWADANVEATQEPALSTSSSAAQELAKRVVVADALNGLPKGFARPDLVVGNPPYATPLKGTVFPESAVRFRVKHPELFGPYVDLAGIHLQAAVDLCGGVAGARVAFVLPQSILAGRDGAGLRSSLTEHAPVVALWATSELLFEANVRVCAVVACVGDEGADVQLAGGSSVEFVAVAPRSRYWAAHAALALGAPKVTLVGEPLGSMVAATAGFRDEYYALAEICRELAEVNSDAPGHDAASARIRPSQTKTQLGDGMAKIATVGSLDPLRSLWGVEPIRFAKRSWREPIINVAELDANPRMCAWLGQQLRPKVLLPTQSKVFEPFVDRDGTHVPVTPVLALHCAIEDLDHVAAIFLAPPIVAWAHQRWFGTAMSVSAIKIAARDVPDFPRPDSQDLWDEAAALVRTADGLSIKKNRQRILAVGRCMNEAYGGDKDVFSWWQSRIV